MWTPRRIVLLAMGYLFVLAGYLGYTLSSLGGIDGLPTLPAHYLESKVGPSDPGDFLRTRVRRVEGRLKQAFGADNPVAKWPIQLELNNRTLVVAAQGFTLESDGRISLMPIAVAVFGKDRGPGGHPEINTLRGDVAFLRFDRPVTNLSEVGGRKVVGGEISGNIRISSNRRTPGIDDDLLVHIGTGPLYYAENKQLIWTHDTVHLEDFNSKPRPTEIWGKGMEVELITEPATSPRPGSRRPGPDKIGGIKRVLLQSNVDMTLYVDGATGFPGGRREVPKPVANRPPEKAKLTIKTSGRFQYEFLKDHDQATFEVPQTDPQRDAASPQHVFVERFFAVLDGRKEVRDQLYCGKLEMHFKKREAAKLGPQPADKPKDTSSLVDRGTDILFVRAQGPQVTLTSDAERLEASGTDLVYDARISRTILRGDRQMTATKDRTRITARELQITDHRATEPGQKSQQTVVALGPGRIDMMDDKQIGTEKIAAQAFWTDKLTTSREGDFDLLVLTGAARFVDRANDQTLQAETLKVWTSSPGTGPGNQMILANAPEGGGRRVQVMEALGNVSTSSRDLNIHDTSRLIVRFRDVPPGAQLPGTGPTPAAPPGGPKALPTRIPAGPVQTLMPPPRPENGPTIRESRKPLQPNTPPTLIDLPGGAPRKGNGPARPIHLSARNVEAWVLRAGSRNSLERVWTEGSVHVKQAPAKPEEKGLDVLGDTLSMDCHAEGNILEVTGDLAQLRMDRIYILGPVVNIDQTRNMAWVNGMGAMQMESQTNFAGDKIARAVPMIVQWRKSMLFHGTYAEFHDGIQAEQENALLVCDSLQVFFDRDIQLKQGTRADQPARVKNIVCHANVRIEESVSRDDRIVKYQRIESGHLRLEALEPDEDAVPAAGGNKPAAGNEIHGSGPGTLRLFQMGGPDPLAQVAPGEKTETKKPEPKLTFIQYSQRLYANSKMNKASFYGQVRVLNLPSNEPTRQINLEDIVADLPREALYMSCDRMTVLNRGTKTHSQQEMLAQGRVTIKAREFWGRAETISFNEAKDQIILDGGEDGEATLFKEVGKGAPPQKITGRKITYIRSTGAFKLDEGRGILGQ